MNRNRVMRGLGLIALVMLAFGLAGCGSEPAPVARPPAPPPAPPPFQPQAVEVALGESGETVTLMTAEGGGFTLSGEAFAGGEVTAENGNMYLLALADGTWTAAFQEPEGIEVMLGDHGGTVIITMTEDGKYFIGEMEIMADSMVMGENGQYYTPALDDEGMWVAMWVMPDAVSVMLGDHGGTVMLQLAEDNSWWIGEMAFADGDMQMGDNGQYYTLTYDMDAGMWMAMHMMPDPVSVMLGDHGGTVMLQQAEDMSWWIGEMAFDSGGMQMGDNGHYYTLTYDMDSGMWMAMWMKPAAVMIALGTSGSVELQQAEDLTWWIGEMAFDSGGTTTAANGNMYMLTYDMDSGMWSSVFVPMEMEIMGTGLVAMTREADDMYDVGGSEETLSADGMGDVTADGGMYHVWMDGGMLMGARYDMPIAEALEEGPRDRDVAGAPLRTPADLSLSDDDSDTVANEAATHLSVDGDLYSLDALFGGGRADRTGMTFVEEAREEVQKLYDQVKALVDINAALDREDRNDFSATYNNKWDRDAQKALDNIFGKGNVNLPDLNTRAGKVDEKEMLADFERLIDALMTADAFDDMLELEADGLFDGGSDALSDTNTDAAEVFGAITSESRVLLGHMGTMRYGVFAKKTREIGTDDLVFTMAADPEDDQGGIGAFAWSTSEITGLTRDLEIQGLAIYEGGTTAVTAAKDPKFYSGDIRLELSLATKRFTTLVSNLTDADGDPWQHLLRDVESITLPRAQLGRSTSFNAGSSATASINYTGFAVAPLSGNLATFSGKLTGEGGENVVGTWTIGSARTDKDDYLAGAFGATMTGTETERAPDTTDAEEKALVSRYEGESEAHLYDREGYVRFQAAGVDYDGDGKAYVDVSIDDLDVAAAADGTFSRSGGAITSFFEEISDLKKQLEAWIALDNANDEDTINNLTQRNEIWATIRTKLRGLFGFDATETIEQDSRGRPDFDADMRLRPSDDEGTEFTVPDDTYAVDDGLDADMVTLQKRTKLDVLSSDTYPTTRTDNSKPRDEDALQELEDVLDALSSAEDFSEALEEGGQFEGLQAEGLGPDGGGNYVIYRDANYDDFADLDGELGGDDRARRVQSTKESPGGDSGGWEVVGRLLTTDYTTFGIAWGATGVDGTRFAYSVLPQTRYPAGSPRYPSQTTATYNGETVFAKGKTAYQGTAEITVKWGAAVADSSVTAVFSDLEKWDGSGVFELTYVLVDSAGNRYLKNGNAVTSGETDFGAEEYTYRDLAPVVVDGAGVTQITPESNVRWDPRNRAADAMGFEVESIVFHRDISVSNSGGGTPAVAGGVSFSAMNSEIDFIFKDKGLGTVESNFETAYIKGEFVGEDADGPLAVLGVFEFHEEVGALIANPRFKEGTTDEIVLDASGMATFNLGVDSDGEPSNPANPYTGDISGNFATETSAMTGQEYTNVLQDANNDSDFTQGIMQGGQFYGAFGTGRP